MNPIEALRSCLPGVRRYSRALAGSQSAGDTLVERVLGQVHLANASSLNGARHSMLQGVSRLYNGETPPFARAEQIGAEARDLTYRLTAMTPLSRQALLLVSMEQLPRDSAAAILGVSRAKLDELLAAARSEIAALTATDVLIIEDEAILALELEKLLIDMGHRVSGNARTRQAAVASARTKRPGLVLADIKLADGSSGIDAVNDITRIALVPSIYVTAYPERLLTGEKLEPTYVVTKPYSPSVLRAIVAQVLFATPSVQ